MSSSNVELAALARSLLRTLSDTELMAALRVGCNDGMAALFERHSTLVFWIARESLHDDSEAEEIVQLAFLDAFRAADQFDPVRENFKTWLLQHTYNGIARLRRVNAPRFPLRTLSDPDLMATLRAGCNDALTVLIERHRTLVFQIARGILRDDGEAEEMVQRVFLDVFRAVDQFNPSRGNFKTWLLQYTYHRSIDRWRHLTANRFYDHDELDELALGELFYGARHLVCSPPQEVACLVEQVLSMLETRQRTVIELTYFEGLTAEEIAHRTGDSVSSVRHNLYRGLSRLRSAFQENCKAGLDFAPERKNRARGMLVEYPRTLE